MVAKILIIVCIYYLILHEIRHFINVARRKG